VIPRAHITAWRQFAPWVSDAQVEQDLILSRVLVEIFRDEFLSGKIAFRGGTALYKLYIKPAYRYSEDIDLVQIKPEPIGPVFDALQRLLNQILGQPKRKQTEEAVTLTYRMESETPPAVPLRLKAEINTREHVAFDGIRRNSFAVNSRWFQGSCEIATFSLEELLATKLRALYQRRKGRDLFDLWTGLTIGKADSGKIVKLFRKYMKAEGLTVNRKSYLKNLEDKMNHPGFVQDIAPLLPATVKYNAAKAFTLISREIIEKLAE
jgi:predicted nucleotidyltransferase component of viral defense system